MQTSEPSDETLTGPGPTGGGVRQLRVLAHLATSRTALTTREVATQVEIARPTAHRILLALVAEGWATAHGNPVRFEPSWQLVELGFRTAARSRVREAMLAASRPVVTRTGFGVILSFYERGTVLCTDSVELQNGVPVTRLLGHRFPARQTAAGRVFLAHLAEDQPDGSAGDDEALFDHIRSAGHASRTEAEAPVVGVRSGGLAVPVFDQDLRVAGVIGLVLPPQLDEATWHPLVGELQLAAGNASADLGSHHATQA